MMLALRYLSSLVFIGQMYLAMLVLAIFFLPWAVISRNGAFAAVHTYCRYVRWSAGFLVGLRSEVRGEVPDGAVLIASKHQSFFDIIIIVSVLPRPKFIMKKELLWAPIVGWFAKRIGCIPVDRGKRGAAIQKMLEDAHRDKDLGGQLIIYPQGTRVAPNSSRPYKVGTAALYSQLKQICHPAATNVGVFWPRHGILRKPGLAVVEFLKPIEPGLANEAFMDVLKSEIETASDALMQEAGFDARAAREAAEQ